MLTRDARRSHETLILVSLSGMVETPRLQVKLRFV